MNASANNEVFQIDPARLEFGTWCHTRDKAIGEGDINASYSADKIGLEGAVRSPFKWQNALWICTGMVSKGDFRSAECYRLMPIRFFGEEPRSYQQVCLNSSSARARPEGFYHGMRVKHGKQNCVLVGPSASFLATEEKAEKQTDLFDLL
ncbi:MAG: hypothetical protein AAF412_12040 [Pseudomonadota bacterium]